MHVENQLLAQETISVFPSEGLNLHKWHLCSNAGTTNKKFRAFFFQLTMQHVLCLMKLQWKWYWRVYLASSVMNSVLVVLVMINSVWPTSLQCDQPFPRTA